MVLLATPMELSYGMDALKMLLAMTVVIGLALVTIKYFLPLLLRGRRRIKGEIHVIDWAPLEQRKSIYLVHIKEKEIAVGVTEYGACKLGEWPAESHDDS